MRATKKVNYFGVRSRDGLCPRLRRLTGGPFGIQSKQNQESTHLHTPTQQSYHSNRSNMFFKVSAPGRYNTPVMIQSTAYIIESVLSLYLDTFHLGDLADAVCQPRRATAGSSGAVRVRSLLRDTDIQLGGAGD